MDRWFAIERTVGCKPTLYMDVDVIHKDVKRLFYNIYFPIDIKVLADWAQSVDIWVSSPLTSHRAVTVRQDQGDSRVCLARKEMKGPEDSPGCQDLSDFRYASIPPLCARTRISLFLKPYSLVT